MELLTELLQIIEEAKKKTKKVTPAMAKRVYHRDYVKSKDKPYRKYDPSEHKKES